MDPATMIAAITAYIQTDANLIIMVRQAITRQLNTMGNDQLTTIYTSLGLG